MKLTPTVEKFILHWGEMGNRWGINRTVAQIHALLYISPNPLDAEEITETLGVARSNVSTSLRELQSWGVVKAIHVMGERREHYISIQDVWELFQIIMDERKRREIDPTLNLLKACVAEAQKQEETYTQTQLTKLLGFFETVDMWYVKMRKIPTKVLVQFLKMGGKWTQWMNNKEVIEAMNEPTDTTN